MVAPCASVSEPDITLVPTDAWTKKSIDELTGVGNAPAWPTQARQSPATATPTMNGRLIAMPSSWQHLFPECPQEMRQISGEVKARVGMEDSRRHRRARQ